MIGEYADRHLASSIKNADWHLFLSTTSREPNHTGFLPNCRRAATVPGVVWKRGAQMLIRLIWIAVLLAPVKQKIGRGTLEGIIRTQVNPISAISR